MFRDLRDRGSEFRAVALKDLQSGVYGVLRGLFVLKTLGLGFLVVCFMCCLLFWLKLRVLGLTPGLVCHRIRLYSDEYTANHCSQS